MTKHFPCLRGMGAGGAKADAKRYRDGYPGEVDEPSQNDNLKFYTGKMASIPDGDLIDVIHENWRGRYQRLEVHHGYIQWLFPIRENGMNSQSQKLQPHEITALLADPLFRPRLLRSYRLMLDFYGMQLVDESTGKVERSTGNWEARYDNLNHSSHNYLRITRMLKCLGEFGLEHLKRPWCEFFVHEVFVTRALANCKNSLCNYWIPVLKRPEDQAAMVQLLATHGQADPFAPEPERETGAGGRGADRTAARKQASDDDDDDDNDDDTEEDAKLKPGAVKPTTEEGKDDGK